jgi:cyclopropane-fatty-acyl-phospholipid synthase
LTRNVAALDVLPGGPHDRVVSVEMFEHMKNYEALLDRVAGALKPGGKLFVHVFAHRDWSYPSETEGEDNWLGRHFFTGGQMPARGLLPRFQKSLALERDWWWEGTHYAKTAEAWLANHDRREGEIRKVLQGVTGDGARASRRWRIFWMACAELFAYDRGRQWGVAHYLFKKKENT